MLCLVIAGMYFFDFFFNVFWQVTRFVTKRASPAVANGRGIDGEGFVISRRCTFICCVCVWWRCEAALSAQEAGGGGVRLLGGSHTAHQPFKFGCVLPCFSSTLACNCARKFWSKGFCGSR